MTERLGATTVSIRATTRGETIVKRTLRPLAVLVLAAALGAGCSDDPAGSGKADAGAGARAGENPSRTDPDRAVKFAACMREHGVPDFPDANANGEFVFGINVSPAVWARAVEACEDLQPPGSLSAKRSPQQQTASLRFAQCVRDNGVKDFPDPANGEPLVDTTKIPSTDRAGGMTILDAAMQQCRGLMDEAAAGQ